MTKEERDLFAEAEQEIRALRNQRDHLAGQVRVMEIFERALFGSPGGVGMGEDVAWRIKKYLADNPEIKDANK